MNRIITSSQHPHPHVREPSRSLNHKIGHSFIPKSPCHRDVGGSQSRDVGPWDWGALIKQ